MSVVRGRLAPVVAAAAVLVGGANLAAYAANGQPFLLGHSNSETKTATLSNSGQGAALSLKTSAKSAPLQVNSDKVVKHLNADTVDGANASDLKTTTYVLTDSDTTTAHGTQAAWSLSDVPAGRYLVSWDVNLVPITNGDSVACGLTTTNFSRQFAFDSLTDGGNWISDWLSGSTVMKLDPTSEVFFCQALGSGIQLRNPLTISFTKVDKAISHSVTPMLGGRPAVGSGVTR
jgi:hypothetical protein